MKKNIILTGLIITVLVLGIAGAGNTYAQTPSISNENPMTSLVQKIAEKFGLKQADVQEVFDQVRKDRESQMQARYEAQLDTYVKEGKITEAQKQLIINKHKELKANMQKEMDTIAEMTPEQRKAQHDAKKAELDAWAQANGIDPQYLGFFIKVKKGFGMRGGHMFEKKL
jgi:hypothetical protein